MNDNLWSIVGLISIGLIVFGVVGITRHCKRKLFKPTFRNIITAGCDAYDHTIHEGHIIGKVERPVYNGGSTYVKVDFYVIRLEGGHIIERPVQDCHMAADGVLEHRS